jgi:hypothetical protein
MTVTGRVLRPDGRAAANVPVEIIAAPRAPEAGTDVEREAFTVLGRDQTDADGRFDIEAARAPSSRFSGAFALAGADGPGSAFGCVAIGLDAQWVDDSRGTVVPELRLPPEQVIRGKLVDVSGQPIAGVEVHFGGAYTASPAAQGRGFHVANFAPGYVWRGSPTSIRAWPKAVTTDAQGRFTFPGIGRGLLVTFNIRDPRFAQQWLEVRTDEDGGPKEVSAALQPSKIITGRILAADTGRPIPDAVLSVRASADMFGPMMTTKFRADGQGRYRINPSAGNYFRLRAFAPEGRPYLARETEFDWTKGAVQKELDLTLPRGVLIRGKVTEQGTGRPVAGASVQFFPFNQSGDVVFGFEAIVTSKDDGSFQVAVPPGKGHLLVLGPTLEYIPEVIGGNVLYGAGQPGGGRMYTHAIITYEARAGEAAHEISATLRSGRTVRGNVVGPAGEVVRNGVILTRQQIDPTNLVWERNHFLRVRDGRFAVPGLDPEKPAPAYFFDPEHGWGASVELSGRQAGEEVTVQLKPCGRAKVRFVGPDGKPVARLGLGSYVHLLMTPGSTRRFPPDPTRPLEADAAFLNSVDPKHYPSQFATDADGRADLVSLIPGAPYRVSDWSTANVQEKGVQLRKDFTVGPGETIDLGNILVEKPGE